jgi:ABC-2 type transport system ATP-binding protein
VLEHDSIVALKKRHQRIVELAPSASIERFVAALTGAGARVTPLSNGRLRVESSSDSIEWILQLMQAHGLPPAEIIANPDALHEMFIKSISAGHDGADAPPGISPPPKLDRLSADLAASRTHPRSNHDHGSQS